MYEKVYVLIEKKQTIIRFFAPIQCIVLLVIVVSRHYYMTDISEIGAWWVKLFYTLHIFYSNPLSKRFNFQLMFWRFLCRQNHLRGSVILSWAAQNYIILIKIHSFAVVIFEFSLSLFRNVYKTPVNIFVDCHLIPVYTNLYTCTLYFFS